MRFKISCPERYNNLLEETIRDCGGVITHRREGKVQTFLVVSFKEEDFLAFSLKHGIKFQGPRGATAGIKAPQFFLFRISDSAVIENYYQEVK